MPDMKSEQSEQPKNTGTPTASEKKVAANRAPKKATRTSANRTPKKSTRASAQTPAQASAQTPAQAAAPNRPSSASPSLPRTRMVQCVKLGRRLPGLAKPPIPGELGQRIYDSVSEQAWQMWQEHSRLLINHYGLNLADPDARALMRQQMEEFFFGPPEEKPEGWVPEGQGGAKGKGAPEPAASRKK